jgi:hypothetical protein
MVWDKEFKYLCRGMARDLATEEGLAKYLVGGKSPFSIGAAGIEFLEEGVILIGYEEDRKEILVGRIKKGRYRVKRIPLTSLFFPRGR